MSDEPGASSRERLGLLAHELRSPVAALLGLAEWAPRAADAAERRRFVALAVAAARDIDRLLTDPDLLSLRRGPVDVGALVAGFAGPSVAIRGEPVGVVEGDATRLRQVVANLVANGLRHGRRVELEVGARDDRVVVDVSDDGPGVAPGLDPFARGVGTAGSTGYGLWLARAVAEAHGGTLELVDDETAGARFRLALPSASAGR
jgi:two-component system OmpR family sensor kinase